MNEIYSQFKQDMNDPVKLRSFHFLEDATTDHRHILIHLLDSRQYIVTYTRTVIWIDYYEQTDGGLFRRKSDGLHCQVIGYYEMLDLLTLIEDASGRNVWPEWYQDIEAENLKSIDPGYATLSYAPRQPINYITVTFNIEKLKFEDIDDEQTNSHPQSDGNTYS